MTDRIIPDECSECGRDLDGEYDVEVYEVENPTESGYRNPVIEYSNELVRGDGTVELHYPTCPDCEPPTKPPVPGQKKHHIHLFQSAFFALVFGVTAIPPTSLAWFNIAFAACFSAILAAVAAGELLQLQRIQARDGSPMRGHEPRLANPSTPEQRIREAYLAGEIDEDEFEARLDEELAEEERDRETRVMER